MRIARGLKDLAMNLGSDTVGKTIEWNNVCSLGKNRDAIDYELETLSPLVGDAA